MTTINIIRPTPTANFTVLPNVLFELGRHYPEIKPRDIGVLNYLFTKPEVWQPKTKDLAKAMNVSEWGVRQSLTRLIKLGFASYTRNNLGYTQWCISVPESLLPLEKSPHVEIPHEGNQSVLTNNEKTVIIKKTTTRCVSEGNLGYSDTPSDYINDPQIADIEVVAETIDVTPNIDTVVVEVVKVEMVAETIIESVTAVEPTPQLELPTQLTDIEKLTAKKSIAKADLDNTTYEVIVLALKTALTLGGVRSPIAYLNGLINKAKDGTLDFSNYNKLKVSKCQLLNRSDEIRNLFARHGDPILLELVTNGVIHIKSLGLIQYDEVNKLGLINSDWAKKYADIQLQKMSKLTPNKLTTASIKKKQHTAMSADEFEAAKQKQIEMAMALLNQ